MLISWNWLDDYVDLSGQTPETLAAILTGLGLEVDAIHRREGGYDRVYVGLVTAVQAHPKADRLRLATVDVGAEGTFDIVCGAPNVAEGMRAPVALLGASLPNGLVVREAKIRGVTSTGMLCAPDELGLSDSHDGLMVLAETAVPGTLIAEHLATFEPERAPSNHDVVLELSITPNRGDCLSHVGVAREVSAHLGRTLKVPTPPAASAAASPDEITVHIEDARCPRYMAAVLHNVKVGPSPTWLRHAVEAAGARSINNVVDITNYVSFELGHPQHAFDLDKLSGASVVIRAGRAGEELEAINHETYAVDGGDLVIADAERPVAIAGVMGGAGSEVSEATTSIVFECAQFDPSSVRRTAKRLGLHSESSHRFERGVDPNGVERAMLRAIELLGRTQEAAPTLAQLTDVCPEVQSNPGLHLRTARCNGLLGIDLETEDVRRLFDPIGLTCTPTDTGVDVFVPTWRFDLEREIDLVEEVARCHGLDKIEAVLPEGNLGHVHKLRTTPVGGMPPVGATLLDWREAKRETALRQSLQDAGLHEAVNYAFVDGRDLEALRFDTDDVRGKPVALTNPMSVEQSVMRTTLVTGLLAALNRNQAQQASGVALFELGTVFWRAAQRPEEPQMLSFILWGERPRHWASAPLLWDCWDARGLVDGISTQLERKLTLVDADDAVAPWLHPGVRAGVSFQGRVIGALGEVHPAVLTAMGVAGPVYACEIRVDGLLPTPNKARQVQSLPRFPKSSRDVALLLDAGVSFQRIGRAVESRRPAILEQWQIFDVYTGKGIDPGKRSIALKMVYRDPKAADADKGRTLTDDEVTTAHEALVKHLAETLGAERR